MAGHYVGGGRELLFDGIEMGQSLLHPERVDLPTSLHSFFQGLLQIVSGNLHSQRIGEVLAGALFVLHPGGMRERDPHRLAIHQELDVNGVSVPGRDRDNQRLIDAMNLLPGPALVGVEIVVHGLR